MIEPVTVTAAVYLTDRALAQFTRSRLRVRLLALAPALPPGSRIGECYGRGWYIVTGLPAPAAQGKR
jgi:hypothetical protein